MARPNHLEIIIQEGGNVIAEGLRPPMLVRQEAGIWQIRNGRLVNILLEMDQEDHENDVTMGHDIIIGDNLNDLDDDLGE